MFVNTLASCLCSVGTLRKPKSLTEFQQKIIWALHFYSDFATPRQALRFLAVVYTSK